MNLKPAISTDEIGLLIKLMATPHRFKLDDIEPELVCKYDLTAWPAAWQGTQATHTCAFTE